MGAERALGAPLGDWGGAEPPSRESLRGERVLLRPLDAAADAEPLYAASHPPQGDPGTWTYLFDGPYAEEDEMRAALEADQARADAVFFAIAPLPGERPQGVASYLRIEPEHGSIEIGNIWFGPALRRTVAATEAIFLLARHAFEGLGYRRLEWKCNALNAPSRAAAERFGFRFEGVFRKHLAVKGRNRDTAWFAIVDDEWPAVRAGFEAWLDPANFDADGAQRRSLAELR